MLLLFIYLYRNGQLKASVLFGLFIFSFFVRLFLTLAAYSKDGGALSFHFHMSLVVGNNTAPFDPLCGSGGCQWGPPNENHANSLRVLVDNTYFSTSSRIGTFIFGWLVARLYYSFTREKKPLPKLLNSLLFSTVLPLAGLSICIFTHVERHIQSDFVMNMLFHACVRHIFAASLGLLLLQLITGCTHTIPSLFRTVLSSSFWYPGSILSFSIYIYHLIIILMSFGILGAPGSDGPKPREDMSKILTTKSILIRVGLVYLISSVLCLFLHLWIEKKGIQFGTQFFSKPKTS